MVKLEKLTSTPTSTPTFTPTIIPTITSSITPVNTQISNNFPFESRVLGLRFIAGGWDLHYADMLNAAKTGIPAWSGATLAFSDLWVSSPAQPGDCQVQVKFYLNGINSGEQIGESLLQDALPEQTPIEKINFLKFTQDDKSWQVGDDWKSIDLVTSLRCGGKEVSQNQSSILLNRNGTAWLNPFMDAKFAEISYQVNTEAVLHLDLRQSLENGITLKSGDRFCIPEVWYRSRNAPKIGRMVFDASLGPYNAGNYRNSPTHLFIDGIHKLENYQPFCWKVPEADTYLTLILYDGGGTVMDFLYIPVFVSKN
jgi:hypothetical protein